MKTQLFFVGLALAACGGVKSNTQPVAPDAAISMADGAQDVPDAPAGMIYASCAAIAAAQPAATSGEYVIDPDGSGGSAPFTVLCEMAVFGGGWTQVNDRLAASLAPEVNRSYLYLYGSTAYASPCTQLIWNWSSGSGQELTGMYAYLNASGSGTLQCSGSVEKPAWGIGCSSGPGQTDKVLPIDAEDPTAGTSEICQDLPGAFGASPPCVTGVAIFTKEGCTP